MATSLKHTAHVHVCVRVCVWGLRTKAGNSFVSFRFCLLAFFSTAQAGVLPKWPSSNSSDIFRQLSDSQVWHPQHKAKVKWHRRSHRAGWAGNRHRQPAAILQQPKKYAAVFCIPFFSICLFLPSYAAWGDSVSDNPRQEAAAQPPTDGNADADADVDVDDSCF